MELFESVPSRVLADASRRHRWIRGDWQIASWLFHDVPGADGRTKNVLSWLSRWKIADNLRRSLTPVLLFAMLLLGWTLTPSAAGFWSLLAATITFGPVAFRTGLCILRKSEGKPWMLHLADEARSCLHGLAGEAISWCMLPYVAHVHLDAIARSLYRLYVSHRRLLEWTTASDAETRSEIGCRDHYERMWACTIASCGMAAFLSVAQPIALVGAGPVLIMWLLAPMIAWWISQPTGGRSPKFTAEEKMHLGRWARQTWHFFETCVNRKTHWLPPDNLQEHRRRTVALRTSPTNIGMGLLANLAACDMGYLPPSAMLDRTARTLRTMLHLEQHRGHFYNWYDIHTLQPVEPRYVSSVDSGNLWAALIVLHAGAEELRDRSLVPPRLIQAVRETAEVIALVSKPFRRSPQGIRFAGSFDAFQRCCESVSGLKTVDACRNVRRLHDRAREMAAAVPEELSEVKEWTRAMVRQCPRQSETCASMLSGGIIPRPGFSIESKSSNSTVLCFRGNNVKYLGDFAPQLRSWIALHAIATARSSGASRKMPSRCCGTGDPVNASGPLSRKLEAALEDIAHRVATS